LLKIACVVTLHVVCVSDLQAITIHVPADQPTIQAAVDIANPGDVVMLADMTFTGPGNRDVNFLGKAITVQSESDNPLACIIDCEGNSADPHRGFIFSTGETNVSVLRGVTITNGYDIVSSQVDGKGGAIYCTAAPRIENCRFVNCVASGTWYSEGLGGAVYCTAAAEFSDCYFAGNTAYYGGAVYSHADVSFNNCRFVDNNGTFAGAIYHSGGSPVFTACDFENNYAYGSGGALEFRGPVTPFFEHCSFLNNTSEPMAGDTDGGAVYGDFDTIPTFHYCDFIGNESGYYGGAVSSRAPTFLGCLFADNVAHDGHAGFGGFGGGVYCWDESSFDRCTFAGNSSENASAIAHSGTDPLTINQTIICFSTRGEAIWRDTADNMTITCTDIYGNTDGDWTGVIAGMAATDGNFSADPQFCGELGTYIYTLQSDSPCAPSNNDCGVLIGARGVNCSSTPNFIHDFQAEVGGYQINLSWRVSTTGGTGSCLLEGSWRNLNWQVPCSALSTGQYQALDCSPHLQPGRTVVYTLYWQDESGNRQRLQQLEATLDETMPSTGLTRLFPNPFNPQVTIDFTVARPQLVRIAVLDLGGRLVTQLTGQYHGTGAHTVTWQGIDAMGKSVGSGTYLIQIQSEDLRETRRITLVR
jgi:predicted outer membrane repeat protein